MKNKLLSILCLICIVMSSFSISVSAAEISFPDVQKGAWYYGSVMELTARGAINGYPDGTFKPNGTISCVEFLALLVRAVNAGDGDYTVTEGEPWYSEIIQAAYDSGIVVTKADIANLSAPINRAEVTKFIYRVIYGVLGMSMNYDSTAIKNEIKDFSTIKGTAYEYYAVPVYASGIMIGDNIGNLNFYSSLTRAEAATVILRIIDTESRKEHSSVSSMEANPQTMYAPIIEKGSNAGKISPPEERYLCWNALSSAKFYESNGCYWVELNVPELPDGFHWDYYSKVQIKEEYIGTKKYYDMGYALWLDNVMIYKKGQEVRQRGLSGYATSMGDKSPMYLEKFTEWGSYIYDGKGCDRTTVVEKTEQGYKILSKIPNLNNQNKKDMEYVEIAISVKNYEDKNFCTYYLYSSAPNQVQECQHEGTEITWYNFDTTGIFNW